MVQSFHPDVCDSLFILTHLAEMFNMGLDGLISKIGAGTQGGLARWEVV